MSGAEAFELSDLETRKARSAGAYLEFLRSASLSCGLYALPAGGTDPQKPHAEDEVYYVVRGRATIRVAQEDMPVHAGSVVFVPSKVEHRFHSIAEDLEVLVLFAPAESTVEHPARRRA